MSDLRLFLFIVVNAILVIGFAVFAGVCCDMHHDRFFIINGNQVYVCDDVHGCPFHEDGVDFVSIADVYCINGEYYYFRGNLSTHIPAEKIRKGD